MREKNQTKFRSPSISIEQLVAEMVDRLVPINHALNLITHRMEQRSLSIESAQETRLVKQIQGCIRSLELRLSEIASDHHLTTTSSESFSINTIVQSVLNDLQSELDAKFLLVKTDIPLEDAVEADAELIRMAIYLLVRNAIAACQFDGEILITLSIDQRFWDLEVADSGPGLDESFRNSFQPESAAWGKLSKEFQHCITKVSQIANCHGGTISMANCAQGGAAISIIVPQRVVTQSPNPAKPTDHRNAA